MDPSEALTEIKDSLSWVLLVKRNKKNQYQFNQPANERRSCVPQIAVLYLSFSVSRDQNPAKIKLTNHSLIATKDSPGSTNTISTQIGVSPKSPSSSFNRMTRQLFCYRWCLYCVYKNLIRFLVCKETFYCLFRAKIPFSILSRIVWKGPTSRKIPKWNFT